MEEWALIGAYHRIFLGLLAAAAVSGAGAVFVFFRFRIRKEAALLRAARAAGVTGRAKEKAKQRTGSPRPRREDVRFRGGEETVLLSGQRRKRQKRRDGR